MKIAFFTEAPFTGKIPRSFPNMRVDTAWMCILDAVHYSLNNINSISEHYDIGIIIIPKDKTPLINFPLVEKIRKNCTKVGTMQESYYWYWQDSPVEIQLWYHNFLQSLDFILCHNDHDLKYYSGITNILCDLMPSVMVVDYIHPSTIKKNDVIVGGNWRAAYRGFDSYIVAKEISDDITAITTGRMKPEERMLDIKHLPWVNWLMWMKELSTFRYAVQLGTAAAGSFNLNCSYFGIPCISYKNINTQKYLHPRLSVDDGDILTARQLAHRLVSDKAFYEICSKETKQLYNELYSEEIYKKKMNSFFSKLFDDWDGINNSLSQPLKKW